MPSETAVTAREALHPDAGTVEKRLLDGIRSLVGDRTAYVCFSGGVDSTVVLAACLRSGVTTVALLGVSPSLPEAERLHSHALAAELGAAVEEIETHEMDNPSYRANSGDRCYHCKATLFETVQDFARQRTETGVVLVGTHTGDLGEHRPGLRAAAERNVAAPLVDAGMDKNDVRALARQWKLSNAEKAAAPCLASRLPVGVQVSPERLAQIETVENFLREHGVWPARARWHDAVVRLEIAPDLFPSALAEPFRTQLHAVCRKAGFTFVALDIAGLQSGSLALPLLHA